ncbi:MAG: hypothetical protein M3Z37_11495, partial [Candidatus Eremiobacteraeota bacterium]|nr:hypothetical protein [Candidatus Eremiobacteraeota bacterium]
TVSVDDQFKRDVVAGGKYAPTPCSGTLWVYDYRHHIAAGRQRGHQYSGTILFAAAPPLRLPNRDLSGVVTQRGLGLGDSPERALRALTAPPGALQQFPGNRQALFLRRRVKCAVGWPQYCNHDVEIVFDRKRAVEISLQEYGP